MVNKSLDLAAAALISIVFLIGAIFGFHPSSFSAWAILALLLIFVLPGYTLTALIFARHRLQTPQHLLIVISLSLALVILVGFWLNLTPAKLTTTSWAWVLPGLVLLFSLGAYLRRRRARLLQPSYTPQLNLRQVIVFSLAALVVTSSVGLSQWGAITQPRQPFTQLWALPVKSDGALRVQFGLENQEGIMLGYRLEVISDGQLLAKLEPIYLAQNDSWETILILPQNMPASQVIEANLYRLDKPETPYRHVALQAGP